MPTLNLPKSVENELTKIFTDKYLEGVKTACRRFLHDINNKTSVVADGNVLSEISKQSRELRNSLKKNKPAIKRIHQHMIYEYNKFSTHDFLRDLESKLKILDDMCFINPAKERAENPQKGRPKKTLSTPEHVLAFHLWEFYRQAHGKIAGRICNSYTEKECGPLEKAIDLLRPILGLNSNFNYYFRLIKKEYMENK
jgi:hypothetical protein